MAEATRLIKKYPNRRLYDTQTSSYITLGDVKLLVLENEGFQVVDAKSGEDLTRSILLQIILEEETAGVPIFTSPMLSQIIRFYGNAMQGIMGTFLEKVIQSMMSNYIEQSKNMFVQMQDQFQNQTRSMFTNFGFPNPGEFPGMSGMPGMPGMPGANKAKPDPTKK